MNDDKDIWAVYHTPGEWKEYHSNDISEIKFFWGSLGFAFGALLSGFASLWYFMH